MPAWSWIVIAAAVVIVVAMAVIVARSVNRRNRSERLKNHFGPEYERAVGEAGDQRAGEKELVARERKRQKLDIVALAPEAHAKYAEYWRTVQTAFVRQSVQGDPRAPRPNRRKWGPGLRPLGPNRRPTNRFSPTPTFHGCARAGTMSRRLLSTTPKSASRRPTPSWPRSSNSSRPGSPRRDRGSRRSGLGARRPPRRTFVSR